MKRNPNRVAAGQLTDRTAAENPLLGEVKGKVIHGPAERNQIIELFNDLRVLRQAHNRFKHDHGLSISVAAIDHHVSDLLYPNEYPAEQAWEAIRYLVKMGFWHLRRLERRMG